MGEKNTISLLSSINGYLKAISEEAKQNKAPQEAAKNTQTTMTKNLNQGSVLSGAITQPKGQVGDISISAAMMASLNGLPTVILAIGKLKKKDVEAFTKTLLAIQTTINKFAEGSKDIKGADNLVKIIQSLSNLEKVGLVKLSTSLKIANAFGFSKALIKFVEGVSKAAQKAGKIKKSDLNKLSNISNSIKAFSSLTKGLALIMVSVIGMAAAMKVFGTKEILKSVGITLGILTTLSALALTIGILSKRMSSATRGLNSVAKFILLMQGAVLGTLLIGVIAQKAWPQILIGFSVISGIILGYVAVAALASFLFKFVAINKVALGAVMMMAAYGMAVTLGTLLVGYVAQMAWPQILVGFTTISGIILGYVAVAALASFLFKFITFNRAALMGVMLMAGYGIALTLGTLLMGYVAQEAWPDILKGFAAVSGVILGYVAIASAASAIAKLSPTFKKDILSVALMAGLGMGLVLGTLLMGFVAEEAWDDIAIGFITIGLIIEGYAGLARLVSWTAKGIYGAKNDLLTVGAFAAGCGLLLLEMAAIPWLIKKMHVTVGEIAATFGGIVAIMGSLIGVMRILKAKELSSGSKAAIASLKELTLISFAIEGLMAGLVGIAILAKKADPVYLVGTVATFALIVKGLTAVVVFLKQHNRTLQTGAKNLLMVEAIALGAEAIMTGIILLAKQMDKSMIVTIPITIGLMIGVIGGVIGLAKIVNNSKINAVQAAKNLLLLEGVALGAAAVLAGIIGVSVLQKKANVTYEEIGKTLLAISGVILGLVGISMLVEKHNKNLTKGAKSLLLLEGVALGAEAVLAGVIGLIVLKRTAKVDYVDIAEILTLIGGITLGIVGISILVEKHNKDLKKGAISLMMLEGVALGAEAVLAGIIGLIALKRAAKVSDADIFKTLAAIGLIIGGMGALAIMIDKFKKQISKAIPSMLMIDLFAVNAGVLLLGVIGLIILQKKFNIESKDVLTITAAMALIMTSMAGLAILVNKFDNQIRKAIPGLLVIDAFAVNAGILLLGVIGLAVIQKKAGVSTEDVLLTIVGMSLIVGGMGALAILVDKFNKQITKALPGLGIISLFALAAGALLAGVIGLVALKNKAKAGWDDVFFTIGAMATIVGGFGLLAGVVGSFIAPIAAALPGIGVITLFALASEALLAGVIGLVALKNKVKADWSDIFITIGAMATIVAGFGALGAAVGLAAAPVALGLLGIPTIILLAESGRSLLKEIIDLVAYKNKVKANWPDIFKTVGAMATIVAGFGVLGAGIGLVSIPVLLGLAGIPTIIKLSKAGLDLLRGIVNLVALKNKSKVNWDDITKTISTITKIVGLFGLLGTAVGVVSAPVLLGLAGIPTISKLSKAGLSMLSGIIALAAYKNKSKVSWEEISTTVKSITKIVGLFGLLGAAVGVAAPLIAPALLAIPSIYQLGHSSGEILGDVIDLVDKKQQAKASWDDIDTLLSKLKETVESFGFIAAAASLACPFIIAGAVGLDAAIDMANKTTNLTDKIIDTTIKAKALGSDGWKLIDNTLSCMHKIISGDGKIPGFQQVAMSATLALPFLLLGSKGIKKVAESAGEVSDALVKISVAAKAIKGFKSEEIINVITYFDDIVDKLYDVIGFKFAWKTRAIRGQKDNIASVSQATIDIGTMLASVAGVAKEGGFMRTAHIKPDGNFAFGPWVNAIAATSTLVGTLKFFVDTMFETFNKINVGSAERISKGMQMVEGIMQPVSNFALAMGAFQDAGNGKIRQIKYDDKGKLVDTPAIDVASVAKVIGNAISNFCNVLFSPTNEAIWESMVKGGSYGRNYTSGEDGSSSSEIVYKPGNAHNAMGILAVILDPICNFASTLAMFESGGDNILKIPIFDDKGNIKGYREINVIDVTTSISTAVTTFITKLGDESVKWIELYKSFNREAVYESRSKGFLRGKEQVLKTAAGNDMADAFGVFGAIIQPVVSFATLLKSFETKNGILLSYDENGKSHPVDVVKVAKTIGSAITSFITQLSSSAVLKGKSLDLFKEQETVIVTAVDSLGKALENLGKVDTDNASAFYDVFKKIMDLTYSAGDDTHSLLTNNVINNLACLYAIFDKFNEIPSIESNTALLTLQSLKDLFENFGQKDSGLSSTLTLLGDLKTKLESIVNIDAVNILKNQLSEFSNTINSSVIVSITNLSSIFDNLNTSLQGDFNKGISALTNINEVLLTISDPSSGLSLAVTLFGNFKDRLDGFTNITVLDDLKNKLGAFNNSIDSNVISLISNFTDVLDKLNTSLQQSSSISSLTSLNNILTEFSNPTSGLSVVVKLFGDFKDRLDGFTSITVIDDLKNKITLFNTAIDSSVIASITNLSQVFTNLNDTLKIIYTPSATALTNLNDILTAFSNKDSGLSIAVKLFGDFKDRLEGFTNNDIIDTLRNQLFTFSSTIDSSVVESLTNLSDKLSVLHTTLQSNIDPTTELLINLNSKLIEFGKPNSGFNSITSIFDNFNKQLETLNSEVNSLQEGTEVLSSFSSVIDSGVVASISNLYNALLDNKLNIARDNFNAITNTNTKNKKGIKVNADNIKISFDRARISLKGFDKVLSAENNKRVKNINNLSDAVKSLNKETKDMDAKFGRVAEALKALATISTENAANNISKVISALGNVRASEGGETGGSGKGVSIDTGKLAEALSGAIAAAFDGTEIKLKENAEKETGIKQLHGYLDVPGASEKWNENYGEF